jgi:hypothetical protein
MPEAPYRFSLTELEVDPQFVTKVSSTLEVADEDVRLALAAGNERLMRALGLESAPLQVAGASLRANGVVGLVRLTPRLELEIAPKYLGADSPTWREDFFFVANLSRFGRLLPEDRLASGLTGHSGLANLMGQALIELYSQNSRRPLGRIGPRWCMTSTSWETLIQKTWRCQHRRGTASASRHLRATTRTTVS